MEGVDGLGVEVENEDEGEGGARKLGDGGSCELTGDTGSIVRDVPLTLFGGGLPLC